MTASLSSKQTEAYERDGYICPVDALDPALAMRLCDDIAAFGQRHNLQEALILRNKAHLRMPSLIPIIKNPSVLDAVEGILGPDILCWGSSLFIKEPGGSEFVAWHQDSYYWDMQPADVCVAWIALQPSTLENGAMRVLPGTHAKPTIDHKTSKKGSKNMLFTHEEIAIDVNQEDSVACILKPGQMSIHHMGVVHGSGRNSSSERRIGYSITYLAPHVVHSGKRNSAMLVHGEDRHRHFVADPISDQEMDPEICAFIETPYGGALPVTARDERPNQDFYRNNPAA